jgi:DNA mismatch endonuclease (patch repair protein)
MVDRLSPEKRSALMGRIKGKNTKPELLVRRMLFAMGYRYRLHDRSLPGSPDLVFSKRRAAVFIHGCFWHDHAGCRLAYKPKSNAGFWAAKIQRNAERDVESLEKLAANGWRTLVVWECELTSPEAVKAALVDFLGPPSSS